MRLENTSSIEGVFVVLQLVWKYMPLYLGKLLHESICTPSMVSSISLRSVLFDTR